MFLFLCSLLFLAEERKLRGFRDEEVLILCITSRGRGLQIEVRRSITQNVYGGKVSQSDQKVGKRD